MTVAFFPGDLNVTPGVIDLVSGGLDIRPFLVRHVCGDWGDVDANDFKANQSALRNGSRIVSSYKLTDTVTIWIISDASADPRRRERTTILLPDEY